MLWIQSRGKSKTSLLQTEMCGSWDAGGRGHSSLLQAADKANSKDRGNIVRTKEFPCVALFKGSHCPWTQENEVGGSMNRLSSWQAEEAKERLVAQESWGTCCSFHLWGCCPGWKSRRGHCSSWGSDRWETWGGNVAQWKLTENALSWSGFEFKFCTSFLPHPLQANMSKKEKGLVSFSGAQNKQILCRMRGAQSPKP